MMRHRFCQYFALGFLLAAQSALAVETAAVITNTSTAVDAGMASLGGAKWFKARDYSSVVGNNALRNAAANRANGARGGRPRKNKENHGRGSSSSKG